MWDEIVCVEISVFDQEILVVLFGYRFLATNIIESSFCLNAWFVNDLLYYLSQSQKIKQFMIVLYSKLDL